MIGTAGEIAEDLEAWFENAAADGFTFCSAMLPQGIDDIASLLLPVVRKRGVSRSEYEASTLRGNLRLPRLYYRTDGTYLINAL